MSDLGGYCGFSNVMDVSLVGKEYGVWDELRSRYLSSSAEPTYALN
jgi:hypothetical protein